MLNREDYYDIESSLCQRNISVPIWKLRSFPILLLTGPCSLGLSVNAALRRFDDTHEFSPGWLPPLNDTVDWGDSLILLTDRYDMGELRFTDLGRNLQVASTNADQFARNPIARKAGNRPPVHYSKSESDIVGSKLTYKDDMISNIRYTLTVSHSFVE